VDFPWTLFTVQSISAKLNADEICMPLGDSETGRPCVGAVCGHRRADGPGNESVGAINRLGNASLIPKPPVMVSPKVIIPSSNSRACAIKRVELVRHGQSHSGVDIAD
jgi:hypothetical protein